MDKYVKVDKQEPTPEPNEIRLPYSNKISSSIEHGLNLLNTENLIFMKAIGSNLISKAIFVAEILKHRVAGLHQITEVGTAGVITEYLPKEEGLEKVELVKQAPFIKITLSKNPLDKTNPGYQAPIPESLVQPRTETTTGTTGDQSARGRGGFRGRGRGGFRGGRGGFRGGRGGFRGRGRGGFRSEYSGAPHGFDLETTGGSSGGGNDVNIDDNNNSNTNTENGNGNGNEHGDHGSGFRGRGRGRGFRGRGRGRGFRGRGRGRGGFTSSEVPLLSNP